MYICHICNILQLCDQSLTCQSQDATPCPFIREATTPSPTVTIKSRSAPAFQSMQSDSIGVDANISLMETFTHNRPSSTSLNGTGTGLLTNVKRWRKFRKGLLPREKLFTSSSCARITAFSLYGVKRQIKCLTLKNTKDKQTRKTNKKQNKKYQPPAYQAIPQFLDLCISKSQLNFNLLFFVVTGSWAERVLWSTSVSPNGAYTGIYT